MLPASGRGLCGALALGRPRQTSRHAHTEGKNRIPRQTHATVFEFTHEGIVPVGL